MKQHILTAVICAMLCITSGFVGAWTVVKLTSRGTPSALQVTKLEIVDDKGQVRGRFTVENDERVSLRLLSPENVPVLEMTSSSGQSGPKLAYDPSGQIVIRDHAGESIIQIGTIRDGEGTILFSSQKTRGQVSLGYQPYGDVVDGVDRGIWGLEVKGANHSNTGVGVYTEDGIAQRFVGPAVTTGCRNSCAVCP